MSLTVKIFATSRRHAVAAVTCSSYREYCNNVNVIENASLSALKRGTGGRSSFNGTVATVFGATGFVGRYLVNALGKMGTQVIIPYRSEPDDYEVKKLKLCGDLGQILFLPFDLRDPASIRKAIKYSNVVINLIGSHFETSNYSFYDVHVEGAREIAAACKDMNVKRLIHFSSLNVTMTPKAFMFKKPLHFLPSKLKGEEAVFSEFPDATIFRPANIYGLYDNFFWAFSTRHRKTFDSIPLWAAGKKTVKQPVYIDDVVKGVIAAVQNPETKGNIYQAVGPERYLLSEIADYCGRIYCREEDVKTHHDSKTDIYLFVKIILNRYIFGRFWNRPRFELCLEQLEMESITDVVDPTLYTLEDLGVKPVKLETKAEHIVRVKNLSKGGHYRDLVQFMKVKPPTPHGFI